MKRFNVTVNGKAYDVAVEEITDGSAPVVSAPVAPAPAKPAPAPSPAPVAEKGEGEAVSAPMSGTILDVKANVGDTVSRGQVIMVLEAMKMENDIVSPCDGKITSILVKKGDTVNPSDTLATVQ
ncbi:MAG TPA: acetyl-CoA carboxylase biotin carboxyl carrier protein subunit [Ruminococcus sp.]|nr:acetyl-CoA carboxylase biotin carboxyl carrier protein subunit [Ruminococcus sp.]